MRIMMDETSDCHHRELGVMISVRIRMELRPSWLVRMGGLLYLVGYK